MNRINFDSVIMSHIYIYVYAYDKGGNRETEKIYAFTTGDTLGEVLETKTSEYNYLVWKDRLSSFNGKTVTYDSAGNPTSYDGKTFTWDGRNLKEIALADGSKTQFEYDQDGLRTQKRQYNENGDLDYFVDYIWEDGKLVYQYLTLAVYITNRYGVTTMRKLGPITSKVIYDDSGLPQGFMVNDASQYAFVRNLQGDVIAMIDQNGETVMEYSYDPWGKIEYHLSDESLTEEDAALITALCPLTYRGYNYDFTTGLYYLQSRYYNPEWGRFLNCDDTNILLATQGTTHNANLFAYCDNNPVNNIDPTGYDPIDIAIGTINYILIPLICMMQRMVDTGYSYIVDQAIDIDSYVSTDPAGILYYQFRFITVKGGSGRFSYEHRYDVDFYYGFYDKWKAYLDNKKATAGIAGLLLTIKDIFVEKAVSAVSEGLLDIPYAFLKNITDVPLNSYIKQHKKFVDNSLAVLESKRYVRDKEKIPFFAMGGILDTTFVPMDSSQCTYRLIYKGDDVIYELG